jgi:hypothetical protein
MSRFLTLILLGSVLSFGQQNANMTAGPPQPGANVSVAPVGTTGGVSACYWVVTNFIAGSIINYTPACASNLNGTLNGSNYEHVTWAPAVGFGITYDVLKTANKTFPVQGATDAIATGLTVTTYNDQGGALSPYTIPGFPYQNAAGFCRVNNWDFTPLPAIECLQNFQAFLTQVALGDGNLGLQAHGQGANIGIELLGKGTGPLIWNGQQLADSAGAREGLVYSVEASVPIASVNAGLTLVPAVTGRTLKVVHVLEQAVGGTVGTCTDIRISDTNSSPVDVTTTVAASLVSGTILDEANAGVTVDAGFGVPLTAGKGLQIRSTGSACVTATSVFVIVLYKINS